MASVTGKTSIKIDELINSQIIDVTIDVAGNLLFETRGGAVINAGQVAPRESPIFTGNPQAPTPLDSDDDSSIATTEFVKNLLALLSFAPLDSPVFTGTPTAPTPDTADNDTSIATTAFVKAQHTDSGWTAFPFAAAYQSYPGTEYVCQYRRIDKLVSSRGIFRLTSGANLAANTSYMIGTLPAGVRPSKQEWAMVPTNLQTVSARLIIATTGDVTVISPSVVAYISINHAWLID